MWWRRGRNGRSWVWGAWVDWLYAVSSVTSPLTIATMDITSRGPTSNTRPPPLATFHSISYISLSFFLAIDTYIPNSTCYLNIITPVHVILTMAIRADFAPTLTFLVCVSPSRFHYFSLSLDHVDNVLYSYLSYFVVNPHSHLSHNIKQIYNIFFHICGGGGGAPFVRTVMTDANLQRTEGVGTNQQEKEIRTSIHSLIHRGEIL